MRKSIPVFMFGILFFLISSEANAALTAPEIIFPRKNSIISVTQPTFEWRSVRGATRYQIQVGTDINFSSPIVDAVTSSTSLACPVSLETGGYYLRVRAGNPRNWEDWSENNWGFSVEPTSSNRVSLYRPENGETLSGVTPDFSWSEISGASEYQIQISTVEDFSSTLEDEIVRYGRANASAVDLQNHVIYYWRVRAHLADGWTEWSFVRNFSWRENLLILRPRPRAIVNEARPNFSWSNFSSATQYQIQLSRNSEFSSNAIDSTVTEPNLTAPFNLVNGNYYVRVRACYGDIWDPWCETVNFTITTYATPAAVILGSPNNDAAINSRTPDFRWRITSAATEYVLEVSASSDFSALEISRTLSGTSYGATADEQLNEGRHFWRVKAKNPTCEGPYSEARSFNINVGGIPAAVTLDAPSEGAGISILRPRFTWQQLDDADSYNIQVSHGSNFSNLAFEANIVTGQISSPEDLTKGGRYSWRVRAQNRSGFGPWSGVRTFLVNLDAHKAPCIPVLVIPNDNAVVNSSRPVFSWSCFSMRGDDPLLHYTIEVATQNNFYPSSIVYSARRIIVDAVPDRNLSEGGPYYWRVNKSTHDGTGDWSETRTFRIQYELPPAPLAGQPHGQILVGNRRPEFSWRISTGYGISSSHIQFSLRQDFSDIALEENVANLPDQVTVTFTPSGDLPYGNLYWRVRAQNNLGFSPWSQVWNVNLPHVEPTRVVLLSPANRSQVAALRPVFEWEPPNFCSDYGIQISRRRDFSDLVADETFAAARGASFTPTADLQDSAIYFWRVRQGMMGVYDWAGWSETWDFRVNTHASAVILDYPPDNSALNVIRPEFRWQAVRDAHHYTLEVSDRENFSNTVIRLSPNTNSIYANRDLNDGLYFWRVLANFPDGFATNQSEARRLRVDRVQPSIRIITPAERVFVSDPLPVEVKVTARVRDSGAAPSGIRKVVFFVDDVEAAEKTRPDADAGMDAYVARIGLNKGAHIYNITVQAFDMAGNSREASFTLELKRGQSKTRPAESAVTGRRPSNFRDNTRAAKEFARGGIKLMGGMSMANMKVSGEISPEATRKSKMGFFGGLGFETGGGRMAFEMDLLYAPGGTILEAVVQTKKGKVTTSGYGITAPILLKVRFMPGTTPYILAGGEIGYILSQKILIEYNGQIEERDVKDEINRLYHGLVFGGGLELQTGGMNLLFEARYNLGLSNQVKEADPGEYAKAAAFTIVLGVKF